MIFRKTLLAFLLFSAPIEAACIAENLFASISEADRHDLDAAVAEVPYPEGNVWRAEKEGSSLHVVGTLHVGDVRHAPALELLRPAVQSADLLVLEVTSESSSALQRHIAEHPETAFIQEGPTLIDLLKPETWALYAAELEARGVPAFFGAKFRPWMLITSLALPPCAMKDPTVAVGLDVMLEHMAHDASVPTAELDRIEELIELFVNGDLEEEVAMLEAMAPTLVLGEALYVTMLDSYFAGRHREIFEMNHLISDAVMDDAGMSTFEEELLHERNARWAERLPDLIENRDAVVAVGALHLSGEDGVLRTIEKLGYALTRLDG